MSAYSSTAKTIAQTNIRMSCELDMLLMEFSYVMVTHFMKSSYFDFMDFHFWRTVDRQLKGISMFYSPLNIG